MFSQPLSPKEAENKNISKLVMHNSETRIDLFDEE